MRNIFDQEKAIEALLYIAPQIGGDMYKTLKILYLADKLHLENFGSLILGDWYCAMDYGPVASNSYDVLKHVRGDKDDIDIPKARESFTIEDNTILPKRDADTSYLSKSDKNCMDEAIRKFGDLSFGELRKLTHDDAYNATELNKRIDIHSIASTLPNGPEVNQYLSDPCPD